MAGSPTSEQAKPFAPSSIFLPRSDDQESALTVTKSIKSGNRNCIIICGCITASFLILAVVLIILSFTVFHIKQPVIKMNGITLTPLKLNNGSQSTTNLTFLADVSVKNPNAGSFKFSNGTTTVFYGGEVIGKGVLPAGAVKARRTVHLNVSVNVRPQKMNGISRLGMNSSTVISGKVKIMKMIKKYSRVEVNCSVIYHLQSQEIQHNCTQHFIWIICYFLVIISFVLIFFLCKNSLFIWQYFEIKKNDFRKKLR